MVPAALREGSAWPGGGAPGGLIVYPAGYYSRAYLRAAAGSACTVMLWLVVPASAIASAMCATALLAFAIYGAQTRLRQVSRVHWNSEGIHVDGPVARHFSWGGLTAVRLDYFSTRRDGANGWMQLKVTTGKGVFRIDSDAEGFDRLVIIALHHADRLGLDVTATTRHNAAAFVRPGGFRPNQ